MNVTVYWIFATMSLLSWFAFGIPKLTANDPNILKSVIVVAHLAASLCTTIACIFNHWRTPNVLGQKWKIIHVYFGRFGVYCSVVGGVCGMWRVVHAWFAEGKEFNVILMLVGAWQITCSVQLFRHIRRAKLRVEPSANVTAPHEIHLLSARVDGHVSENSLRVDIRENSPSEHSLSQHVYYAHALFYTACLGPLWARLFNVHEKGMGTYGRIVMRNYLALSEGTCFVIFVSAQVLLPNILMRGSLIAKRKGAFI